MGGDMNEMAMPRPVDRAPIAFRIFRSMQARGLPGGYKLERRFLEAGLLNVVVETAIGSTERVFVPIGHRRYDPDRMMSYEQEVIDRLVSRITSCGLATVVVDCGADIGFVGGRLSARSSLVEEIVFVEPSTDALPYLHRSAETLTCKTMVAPVAVGREPGRGSLQRPDYDVGDEGRFVDLDDVGGDVVVRTVDQLLGDAELAHLVLKVDVEGLEHDVVAGAAASLRRAASVTVVFEANRNVIARTGIDPVVVVEALSEARGPAGELSVIEAPSLALDTQSPLAPQLPFDPDVANLCYISDRA